jgi:hypothetical protein
MILTNNQQLTFESSTIFHGPVCAKHFCLRCTWWYELLWVCPNYSTQIQCFIMFYHHIPYFQWPSIRVLTGRCGSRATCGASSSWESSLEHEKRGKHHGKNTIFHVLKPKIQRKSWCLFSSKWSQTIQSQVLIRGKQDSNLTFCTSPADYKTSVCLGDTEMSGRGSRRCGAFC